MMTRTLILIILCSTHYLISAQETKFVLKKKNDLNEEYYVLKNDKTIKHGSYVKYRKPYGLQTLELGASPNRLRILVSDSSQTRLRILESGNYLNGEKNGPWLYYHDVDYGNSQNSLKETGEYVGGKKNGVWTSYYLDTIPEIINQEIFKNRKRTDSIEVNIDQQSVKYRSVGMYLNDKRIGEWTSFDNEGNLYQRFNFTKQKLILDKSLKDSLEYNSNRKALFIGGYPCLVSFLYPKLSFDDIIYKMTKDSISIIVSFMINTMGNVEDLNVHKSNSPKVLESELIKLVNSTSGEWLPAISNGEKVNSVYKLGLSIKRGKISATSSEYTYLIRFQPGMD